jgi:ABC-type glycerol-3-phosphate transport system substrate-binding protein
MQNKIIKLIAIVAVLPLIGLGCKNSGTISQESLEPVTLEYWRVFDEPSNLSEISTNFKTLYPNTNVNIKKIRFEEFKEKFILALAEGAGPDIISVHTTWLKEYQKYISKMPEAVTMPTAFLDGKEIRIKLETTRMPSENDIYNNFIDTVFQDIVIDGSIYGLPLGVDTLVLYYNRAMLNQASIPFPPSTWTEFKEQVKLLTIQNSAGKIVQAGTSLGGANNINRAPDILSVLMMQNGTQMTNNTSVTFNQVPATIEGETEIAPGRDALRFYTDFASPAKEIYTWNEEMPEALDAFANQQTAFFFGYSYHLPLIRSLGGDIDIGVAKLPQINTDANQSNIANYWVESVTNQSKHKNEAWAFVNFATSQKNVESFLNSSNKPTALRGLISTQIANQDLAPFASQLLTSRTWYHGRDAQAMEEAMRVMIEDVVKGVKLPDEAINEAVASINLTY